jgi:hypothetical protein
MKEDQIRISFRVRGKQLAQIRDVQELLALNTPGDAYQYLAQRGLEALSAQIQARTVIKKFAGLASAEQMLPLLAHFEGHPPQTPKLTEKSP